MVDQLQGPHLEGEWLTVLDVMGILSLGRKAAWRWLLKYVPPEYKKRRGNRLIVHIDGLKVGLERCVWRPTNQPKGYQGVPGKLPVNVNCRCPKGKFISHLTPEERRARDSRKRKGMRYTRRNKYLSGGRE